MKTPTNFKKQFLPLSLLLFTLSGCSSHDSDFIPYGIKALDVYVYDDETDKEFYAGRIKTNYFNAKNAMSEATALANSIARQNNLSDWSYVDCTVTGSSDCATKVR